MYDSILGMPQSEIMVNIKVVRMDMKKNSYGKFWGSIALILTGSLVRFEIFQTAPKLFLSRNYSSERSN